VPAPNPLVAGDADYSLTFTLEAGDPQDLSLDLQSEEGIVKFPPLHFNGQQSQTFEAKKFHLFPFLQGCVPLILQHLRDRLYLVQIL
jgi:hypothetical protein